METDLEASAGISDPLSTLVPGLFNNAVVRLYAAEPNWPSLAAFLFDTLLAELDKVAEPSRWRLLEPDPSRAISELRSGLTDLHAVVSEQAWGAAQRNAAIRKAARGKTTGALHFRARVARSDAEKRLVDRLRRVERSLGSTGIIVECLRRVPEKRSGLVWPSDEVLIVHRAPTVFEWAAAVEAILAARASHLEDVRSVLAVPSRNGRIVADLGGTLQSQFLPLPDRLDDWLGSPEHQPLQTVLAGMFSSAIDALSQASAIFTGIHAADLLEHERTLAQRSLREAERAIEQVSEMSANGANRDPVEFALELLDSMKTEVEQQILLVENGDAVEDSLATQLVPDDLDEVSGYAQQVGLVKLLLLEWDAEPEGVMERLAEAETRIAAVTGEL